MSFQVNFNTHGPELNAAYQSVISEKDDTNWLIYAFDKGTYDLRVQETGDGGLEELNDEFSDGKIQFAFAKVIDPNTELPKFVFIGWCGSGVPELRKAFFNSQLSDVSKFFKSFHVQINARDEADVDPALIMKRVSESSGANYSVHKESSKAQSRVTPVNSVYKKTEIPDIAAMQRESMTKANAPTPVGTNYKPVQTAPKKMEQRWNMAQNQDTGANAVRAERERHEKEVRDREIEKSRQVSHTPPPAPARPTFQQDDFAAKQEAEKQAAAAREQEENERRYQQQQQEENHRRQQQQQEEEYHRQQQDEERRRQEQEGEERRRQEESDRLRQQEDANRKRQQEEADRLRQQEEADRKRQQEEADRKRQQEEEEEEERERREEEAERHRQHEIATAEHKRRQQEEDQKQAALQSQLNDTADRAVHAAAGAAAGAAIASTAKHHQGVSATVLFAYEASENNEMTLHEGEIVHQIDQVDEGWWFGVSEDGKKQGLFPANYVQILEEEEEEEVPVPQAPPAPAPPAPAAPPAPQQQQQQNDGNVAVALYDYAAEEDNEISFNEGDVITQIEFVSDDWWQGLAANGKNVGLFPANYVELQK
ncbi:hypothetical protein INT47_001985 [Mucor saturninus]|uniref:Uncharacterized protein n=1 Tax=Mucor saturninus TaxID=64648 RepID=A0A8H7RHN7_9FUNG|nr:hypothetical protein INT47_001985 [Mucor saturninus]